MSEDADMFAVIRRISEFEEQQEAAGTIVGGLPESSSSTSSTRGGEVGPLDRQASWVETSNPIKSMKPKPKPDVVHL